MLFINKAINPILGTSVIDTFLGLCWNGAQYIGADYNTLPKNEIKTILLNEQANICCYCMRQLLNNYTTTLEHVAPHQASIEEFDMYTSPFIVANVLHKSLFDRTTQLIPPAQYPHDISYHNLVASCDSNSHCNHYRGDCLILPLFYDNTVQTKVEYDDQGQVFSAEYLDTLAAVGVSTNNELVIFRRIWSELSNIKDDPEDVTEDDILEIIASMQTEVKYERTLNNFWGNPSKKPDLLKYQWFFHYYKQLNNAN